MAAGLGAAGIWGGMYVVSKVVLEVIPPFTLLTLRLLLGAVVIGVLYILAGRPGARSGRRKLVLVGLLGYGISLGLQFVGTRFSTAANAAVVTSASPAFMVLFGLIILNETVTTRKLASLLLATIGVFIVIDVRSIHLDNQQFLGNIVLFAAAITWGLFSVLTRRESFDHDTLTVSFMGFMGGLIVGVPLAGMEAESPPSHLIEKAGR